MIALLSDHDVEYQSRLIWNYFSLADWHQFGVRELLWFRDCGLASDSSDRVVWHYCQLHGLILITANRNQDGAEWHLNFSKAFPCKLIWT